MRTKRKVGESWSAQSFPQQPRYKKNTRCQAHTTTWEDKPCREKSREFFHEKQIRKQAALLSLWCGSDGPVRSPSVCCSEKLPAAVTERKLRISNSHMRPTHLLRLTSTERTSPTHWASPLQEKNPPKQDLQSAVKLKDEKSAIMLMNLSICRGGGALNDPVSRMTSDQWVDLFSS